MRCENHIAGACGSAVTAVLPNRNQRQQRTPMNKPNQAGTAGNGMSPETIFETMAHPGFVAEYLPELSRQIIGSNGDTPSDKQRAAWLAGIESMFERCETYPQHAKIRALLGNWHGTAAVVEHGNNLLEQATPEQLVQALKHEQAQPLRGEPITRHILKHGSDKQLTGSVIEQFTWDDRLKNWATNPKLAAPRASESAQRRRLRRVVEHIQQQLLGDDQNAWNMFLDIVDYGNRIGEAAKLALAIEHQHRPNRHQT